MITINFKFDIGQKVWLPDMECYAIIISLWYVDRGPKYECRWALKGVYNNEYLYEWEIMEKKP